MFSTPDEVFAIIFRCCKVSSVDIDCASFFSLGKSLRFVRDDEDNFQPITSVKSFECEPGGLINLQIQLYTIIYCRCQMRTCESDMEPKCDR